MEQSETNNRLYKYILPLLFFAITVCLYIPSTLFLGNIDEFHINYSDILPILLAFGIVAMAAGMLLALVLRGNRRASMIYMDIIFGVTLAMYIQCNFLNGSLRILNGADAEWDHRSLPAMLSLAAWAVCVMLPQIIRLISEKIQDRIASYGSALLSAIQVVSLIVLLLTTHRTISNNYALTKQDEFKLSPKDNTVVFVVDTLDAQWAETYILSDPDLKRRLEDFTYFDNVVSCGAPTALGMRALLGGNLYDPSVPLDEYYQHAYDDSTLFSDLKHGGYEVKVLTDTSLLNGADFENIDNATSEHKYRLSSVSNFAKSMIKLTAYNVLPYHLKPSFEIYSGELTGNVAIADSDEENYGIDDAVFYQDFQDHGLSLSERDRCFVLYHLFGAHGPCTLNEEAVRVSEEETSLDQQIHGVCKIIFEYIGQMKRLGIYENSTIIITADHGGEALYQSPAVFIKRKNQSGYEVNSTPLTFLNLRATFVEDCVEDFADTYGPGMFDLVEDAGPEFRPHTFDSILFTNVFIFEEPIKGSFLQVQIGSPARNNNLIQSTDTVNPYQPGTTVKLCGPDRTPLFVTSGFSRTEDNYCWTDGDTALIPLSISGPYGDLAFSMEYDPFNERQHVLIYVNDHLILDDILDGTVLEAVPIPGEYVEDGMLQLRFELPDAISPKELGISEDTRKIGISLRSFVITEAGS